MKNFKEKKMEQLKREKISRGFIESTINQEKYLAHLENTRSFDRDTYNKGEEWFNSGLSLEDAPEILRGNMAFIKGFERGKRMAMIAEISKKNSR